ncbi:FAA hydrolase family protein [Dyella solisilvae]|uniref:FAA hydrolase family protein n=1 Tax=Dyella solisilvae TaxID=1920168 RepID=A0A370K3V7_9GAMM|nr:fumarylacetoacetate hydrolase family protein [Dyella solisilvae]RDI97331.1 FAA hydrolase family protein [Dyella solisilvae]
MKLLNFHASDGIRAGLLRPAGVEDLARSGHWQGPLPTSRDGIEQLAARLGEAPAELLPLESLRLAPVVLAPEKVICIGLNYRRHAASAQMSLPKAPSIYGKFANSLSAHGAEVALPVVDHKYDYEAELGVIIGKEARDVPESRALDVVAGYCCVNDLSARSLQLATSQWTAGKMLDGFLPVGPYLATHDEIPDPQTLGIHCFVNGEKRQGSSTGDMIFGVASLIAFLSRLATLKPGDVIATGTPEGVQAGVARPQWLKAGDEVVVEIDGLGRLVTRLTGPVRRREAHPESA